MAVFIALSTDAPCDDSHGPDSATVVTAVFVLTFPFRVEIAFPGLNRVGKPKIAHLEIST